MACAAGRFAVLQVFGKTTHGTSAVRYGVLLLGRHLGEGALLAFGDEEGVVSESVGPVLLAGDISIYDTLEEVFAVAVYEGYGRAEACAAVPYALETLQQQSFVGLVVVAVGSVSCRVYARLAAQSLHFESRVVGKAVEPRTRAYVPRLGQRVAFERRFVLGDILRDAALARRDEREGLAESLRHLAQFVGVVCCEYYLHDCGVISSLIEVRRPDAVTVSMITASAPSPVTLHAVPKLSMATYSEIMRA